MINLNIENIEDIKLKLENKNINLEDVDLNSIDDLLHSSNDIKKDFKIVNDFKLYIVNYAINNNILNNDCINNWKEDILYYSDVKIENGIYRCDRLRDSYDLPCDIKEIYFSPIKSISDINDLIDKIKKSNNSIEKIVVDLPDFTYSKESLEQIKDKDFIVFNSVGNITKYTVKELILIEDYLEQFVKDIKNSNLSPYEKYIAVYNIVKSYKEYKYYLGDKEEDKKYRDQSRFLYLILLNDFIVCSGYAKLLENLLNKVGIECCLWDVNTITGYDKGNNHERLYVNLVDPKYDINGYYMSDPTWDTTQSYILYSRYNYLNLTTNESRKEIMFDKKISKKANLNDQMFNDYTDEEMFNYIKDREKFNKLKNILKTLDKEFYEEIKYEQNVNIDLAKKINNYFKEKINKNIDNKVTMNAILEVVKLIELSYDEKYRDELENFFNDLLNKKNDVLLRKYNTFEQIKKILINLKLKDVYQLIKENNHEKDFYDMLINVFYKMKEERFGIDYLVIDNNGIYFNIKIHENIEEIRNILGSLKERVQGNINSEYFAVYLNEEYLNMSIKEAFDKLLNIKNEYNKLFNNGLGMK